MTAAFATENVEPYFRFEAGSRCCNDRYDGWEVVLFW